VITALASAVVLLVAVLKGAIGFGFPTVATPVLALFLDVKTVIPLLVLPNLAMDTVQARRGGSLALILGAVVMLFVVLNATRVSPRVSPRWASHPGSPGPEDLRSGGARSADGPGRLARLSGRGLSGAGGAPHRPAAAA
jgi:hypothetical protein